MNSYYALLLFSSITLAGALLPGTLHGQSTDKKNPEGPATATESHTLIPSGGLRFSDKDLPSQLSSLCKEKGDRSVGYHIEAENGVEHEAGGADLPVVFFYVVDKYGRKRSESVSTYLNHGFLTFVWIDHQKFLVAINNRHKIFDLLVYQRDAKGHFKMLDADIDSYETREKIFASLHFIKAHPEWKKTGKYPQQAIITHQSVDNEYVSTDHISVGDTFADIPVEVEDVDPWIVIRYRFDVEARKFFRMDATLKEDSDQPGFKVPNAQLEKVLPKIVLKEE